jgi:hypothetical protein
VVPPREDDRLTTPTVRPGAQGMAVVAPVRAQPLRAFATSAGFPGLPDGGRHEGFLEEGDRRRGRQRLGGMRISAQVLSRCQEGLGLPYRRGSSLPWAPVQRIQRIPSQQRRTSRGDGREGCPLQLRESLPRRVLPSHCAGQFMALCDLNQQVLK